VQDDDAMVSFITTGNRTSVDYAIYMEELLLAMADPLPCADTRQRGLSSDSNGRGSLPCVHATETRRCHRGETTYAMGWLKWGPN
jgi:hypothetical protein